MRGTGGTVGGMAAQPGFVTGPQAVDGRPVEIVAIVASAGGLEAVTGVLRELPAGFPAAVVVAQHLGGQASHFVEILRRRIGLPVEWAKDGSAVCPGWVT